MPRHQSSYAQTSIFIRPDLHTPEIISYAQTAIFKYLTLALFMPRQQSPRPRHQPLYKGHQSSMPRHIFFLCPNRNLYKSDINVPRHQSPYDQTPFSYDHISIFLCPDINLPMTRHHFPMIRYKSSYAQTSIFLCPDISLPMTRH